MANPDRGFDDPRYDEPDTFEALDDEEEEGRGRSPVILILSIVVLLGFGAVVWLGYDLGVRDRGPALVGETGGEPPVFAAEEGPVGRVPDDPGGRPVPNQDKLIYDQIAGGTPPQGEQLLPPAETPQPLPEPTATPATEPASPGQVAAAADPQPETPPAAPDPGVEPAAEPAAGPPPSDAVAAVPTTPAPPGGDVFVVQVGSYASDQLAATAWERVKGRNQSLLQGLKPSIKQVDLGDKGVWYRLRVGSFTSREDAADLCARLKANGQECIVGKSS